MSHRAPVECASRKFSFPLWRTSMCLAVMVAGTLLGHSAGIAAEQAAETAESAESGFEALLEERTRGTLRATVEYLRQHPDAADRQTALRWLFTAAVEHHLAADALPAADQLLQSAEAEGELKALAFQVRSLGRAAAKDSRGALEDFDDFLKSVSLRSPQPAVDLATVLSARLQLAGDTDAARALYERLSSRFFLNSYVRRLCEQRTARLSLAGKPAPEITATLPDNEQFPLEDYRGKVLLVDFWATNCAPCLVEFPRMKQLYQQQHGNGFEVIGISLDEDSETVDLFNTTAGLPWPLPLSSTDNDATRGRYRVETIPAMYLVDQKGQVAFVDVRGGLLREAVLQLLKAEPADNP
ncbi:MAG: TlpA family protein disulfide reductase [Planctomycetaceae bacterium]|nr:TlpA family protein disulfide reductase [Planctomycetaceae bacterium]